MAGTGWSICEYPTRSTGHGWLSTESVDEASDNASSSRRGRPFEPLHRLLRSSPERLSARCQAHLSACPVLPCLVQDKETLVALRRRYIHPTLMVAPTPHLGPSPTSAAVAAYESHAGSPPQAQLRQFGSVGVRNAGAVAAKLHLAG
jgi:hypothetical protein